MDPLRVAESVNMRTRGSRTVVDFPTAALWVLVFGGLGMLTWHASLVSEVLEEQGERLDVVEAAQAAHVAEPFHPKSQKYLRFIHELDAKIDALEEGARSGEPVR
jgi:hypothetical protein